MRNPEQRSLAFLSLSRCVLLAVPALAFLPSATPALAQRMDGVIYVDDIETQVRQQQAMRGTNGAAAGRAPSGYHAPPRGTAPHNATRPAAQERSAEASTPGWRSKFAIKNPLAGLFGGNDQPEATVPAPTLQTAAAPNHRPEQQAMHVQPQPSSGTASQHAHSQSLPSGRSSDPFTRSEQHASRPSNVPLAMRPTPPEGDAHFVSDAPTATASPRNTGSVRPTITNADGFAMVSDMDDASLLGQLPTIDTPATRSTVGMPRVEATNAAPNHQMASRAPSAAPAGMSPRASSNPSEVVNQHVVPASATAPAPGQPSRVAAAVSQTPPTTAAPQVRPIENPVAENPASVRQPSDKAIQLLTQASELSQRATTDEEYSQVVQLCRHVMAIESAPAAVRFASDLAGWGLNRRGELKADNGQNQEALLDFEDALRLDPKRWRAIHNRGVIAAQEGRFAEAFDDFNKTLELNAKFAKAYSNRAALFVQAGDLESALEDYRQAIDNDPDLAIAHKGRAKVCHLLGDFHTALQHFDAAMLLAPSDPIIVTYRGDLLTDMGRYHDAAKCYQQAIELDPVSVEAHRNLSWLLATCPSNAVRNPEQALQLAEKNLQLTSQPIDLDYDTLAAAQAATGDFDAAMASMAKALELAPPAELDNYRWRQQLYQQQRPYVTEPAGEVHAAVDTQ